MTDYQFLEGFSAIDILVDKVRESIFAKIDDNEALYDARDVEKVKSNEWFVKRFVFDQKDVDEAIDALNESLLWSKAYGINDLRANQFPREFFDMGIFALGQDREGLKVLYIRLKFYKKYTDWQDIFSKLLTFVLYRLDVETNETRFGVVFDLTGAGISNCDLTLMSSVISLLFKYLPLGAKYIWTYEPSWMLRPVISLFLQLVPEKYRNTVKVVHKKDAKEVIGEENMPHFLGGKNKVAIDVPPDAPTIEQVASVLGLGSAISLRNHCNQVIKGL